MDELLYKDPKTGYNTRGNVKKHQPSPVFKPIVSSTPKIPVKMKLTGQLSRLLSAMKDNEPDEGADVEKVMDDVADAEKVIDDISNDNAAQSAPATQNAPAAQNAPVSQNAPAAAQINEMEFNEEIGETGDNLINKFESRFQSTYSIKLSTFHSMLSNSKKHGPFKNSKAFNSILRQIAIAYSMMRTSFTGDKDKNDNIYADTLASLGNTIAACDNYFYTHDPRTRTGQKRLSMVMEVKHVAESMYEPLKTAFADFRELSAESQMLNSFPSILNKPHGLIKTKEERRNELNQKKTMKEQLEQEVRDLIAENAELAGLSFSMPLFCSSRSGRFQWTIEDYPGRKKIFDADLAKSSEMLSDDKAMKKMGDFADEFKENLNTLTKYIAAAHGYEYNKKKIEEKQKMISSLDDDINPFSQKRKDNAIWLKRLDVGLSEDTARAAKAKNGEAIEHFRDKSTPFAWEKNGDATLGNDAPMESIQIFDHNANEMLSDPNSEGFEAFTQYTTSSTAFNTVLAVYEGSWKLPSKTGEVNIDKFGKGNMIRALTDLIAQSSLPNDVWLQSGQDFTTLNGLIGNIDPDKLKATQSALKKGTIDMAQANADLQQYLGQSKVIPQFLSTTTFMGGGGMAFNDKPVKLNIYAPAGSELMYAGEKGTYAYQEQEILLQRGGTYVIKKMYWGIDKTKYNDAKQITLFLDLELHSELGYRKPQQDPNEWAKNHP